MTIVWHYLCSHWRRSIIEWHIWNTSIKTMRMEISRDIFKAMALCMFRLSWTIIFRTCIFGRSQITFLMVRVYADGSGELLHVLLLNGESSCFTKNCSCFLSRTWKVQWTEKCKRTITNVTSIQKRDSLHLVCIIPHMRPKVEGLLSKTA